VSPRRGNKEQLMVPEATFGSYYGRPIVKASPWEADIPAYLFLGGLAGGSALLAAGADLTGRCALRRATRLTATVAVSVSFVALVHDLGRPSRFYNMLRVAKITSPMSVGTWILTAFGPMAGLAAAGEMLGGPRGVRRLVRLASRPAGLVAAGLAPALASYTAVLLSDTATPSWHEAGRHLPFVFVASASAAAGGMAMVATPLAEAGPARAMAMAGAVADLAISARMESAMGLVAEPMHQGNAGRYLKAAKILTAGGAIGTWLGGRRSRITSALSGVALLAGSVCTRFGIFHAGQQSAADPRYTVEPQRRRLEGRSG
jgi:formate-dependent nitrite reductase membrane component NrfD